MEENIYLQNSELSQTADSQKAPAQVTLSNLEQLIKRCAPNYKELGVSLVLDAGSVYTIFLNAGHGGLEPDWKETYKKLLVEGKGGDIYKQYTTWKTGDGKLFRHGQKLGRGWQLNPHPTIAGASAEFHAAGWFFEGVENRTYIADTVEALKPYVKQGLLNVVVMSHEWQDIPRIKRIDLANAIFAAQKRINPKSRAFWFGQHFNAANGKANGICGFTSVGQTHSDKVVERILRNLNAAGYGFFDRREARAGIQQIGKIRTENGDGDLDHEENFDEVALTKMPAGLMEPNFFDNFADALLIHYDKDFKTAYVSAVVAAIVADAKGMIV